MTEEKQRQAIAKALGWTDIEGGKYPDGLPPNAAAGAEYADIPNWPADANAAMQLCDVLAGGGGLIQCERFADVWRVVVTCPNGAQYEHTAATFAQAVSGAFLKARGLWEE